MMSAGLLNVKSCYLRMWEWSPSDFRNSESVVFGGAVLSYPTLFQTPMRLSEIKPNKIQVFWEIICYVKNSLQNIGVHRSISGTKSTIIPFERLVQNQNKPLPNRATATLSAPPSNWTVPLDSLDGCCGCCMVLYTLVI